jgi:hypothetical protein
MQKPSENEIRDWLKEPTTKYMLETLALRMNELDTIRDLTAENHIDKLAQNKAIEVIENTFEEFYKELPELQNKIAKREFGIVKTLINFTDY